MKSLVILAAGMWSRYGGLKQLDGFGPHGETILEYGIYDAIKAWFEKIIFVIRKDFAEQFEKQIMSPLQQANSTIVFVAVFQSMDALVPEGFDVSHREKPWGTTHAMLMAKDEIDGPFAVINADDWYGPGAYRHVMKYFDKGLWSKNLCLVGYILNNTLSPHGSVNRGVCKVEEATLMQVDERLNITATGDGTTARDEVGNVIALDSTVSMNFWGFDHSQLAVFVEQFGVFVDQHGTDPKKELPIPPVVEHMINNEGYTCDVLTTNDPWCGVSYQADKSFVQEVISGVVDKGVYPQEGLWK